jgi:hypothetical protein
MKKLQLILSFLFVSICANAQITINGVVRDTVTHKPIADANVILQGKNAITIYGYAITDEEGKYSITCTTGADSLLILITGLNVRETRLIISVKSQNVDIYVVSEALQIREVKVKADPIVRRSDTIDYFVNSFADQSDRTIGDVLKKCLVLMYRQTDKFRTTASQSINFISKILICSAVVTGLQPTTYRQRISQKFRFMKTTNP